ncbi:MAG: D-alanyl-D-alanine carboxypeptidase family protein [Oscillospiraceae bacterium]
MKMLKKLFFILPLVLIILTNSTNIYAAYKIPFEIKSKAAYLVNTDTGTVIYEKNAEEKLYPASLTKIMTAIIALERVHDLEGTVVTAKSYLYDEFYGLGVSTADIRRGEEVRMIDLLYALMLPSACEAGSIIADYVGDGNITEFVEMMNQKAKELGAVNTVFKNPHGLFHEEQVTTAKDMYLICKYAMENPIFAKICSTPTYEMPATNVHLEPRYIIHTNYMMSKNRGGEKYYYQHIKGIKTGSLPECGKNLASTASFDGYNYMLITLGAPMIDAEGNKITDNGSFLDAKELYNWAFSFFNIKKILNKDDILGETNIKLSADQDYVTMVADKDVTALLPRGADLSTIQKVKRYDTNIIAPIKKGQLLGQVQLKLNDEVIDTVNLVAYEDVKQSKLLYFKDATLRFFMQTNVKILIAVLVLLIITFMLVKARLKSIIRKRNARMRALRK